MQFSLMRDINDLKPFDRQPAWQFCSARMTKRCELHFVLDHRFKGSLYQATGPTSGGPKNGKVEHLSEVVDGIWCSTGSW